MASVIATRLVSQVIQRRPHFSATKAVVPEPQVGSSTRSPGSVVIKRQRSSVFTPVWTTYVFSSVKLPVPVSIQMLTSGKMGKSSMNRTYAKVEPEFSRRLALARRFKPSIVVFQCLFPPQEATCPS